MTLLSRLIVGFIFIGWQTGAMASSDWSSQFAEKAKQVVKKGGINEEHLGLWMAHLVDGQSHVLYQLNAQKVFVPASLSKIITGVAALKKFPLDFKFKTQLYQVGASGGEKWKGDLYLKGGGDPSFTSESMWVLVNEFVRSGIKKIEGNIVVDDTFFDKVRFDEDREDVRVDRAYDAPVGAMSFNWNSVNIYVRPGAKVGDPVKVTADPMSSYMKVINRAVTTKGNSRSLRVSRVVDPSRPGDSVVVSGGLGISRDEVVVYKSISQPDFWSGIQLKEFLQQRGITITGQVTTGKTPESAKLVASTDSVDFRRIVADMLKYSNNYVAEMLTKNFSAHLGKPPGTMASGLEVIREFLEKEVGFKSEFYNLVNPSGLTRKNRFRPEDIGKLLVYARNDFTMYPEFLAALPIGGVDGTLKDRINGNGKSRVRAKTGMLTGVLGLAGFAGREDQNEITFVLIYNGPQHKMNDVVIVFDKLASLAVNI